MWLSLIIKEYRSTRDNIFKKHIKSNFWDGFVYIGPHQLIDKPLQTNNLLPFETYSHTFGSQFTLMAVETRSPSTPVSIFQVLRGRAGSFPGIWRFVQKYVVNWKLPAALMHSSVCFSCVETVCPLCCASGEAYHFTSTCWHWPEHGPQNKNLSVCSCVDICPVCFWLERGLGCLGKFNPCHFTFNACAHRNLTSI